MSHGMETPIWTGLYGHLSPRDMEMLSLMFDNQSNETRGII